MANFADYFLQPTNATHRRYEALRAFFVEGLTAEQAAKRFGYTIGSFRVMCSTFRSEPRTDFFQPPKMGPQAAPRRDPVRDVVVALRKQNLSIYEISAALKEKKYELSPSGVGKLLKEEGFARLPRRHDDERPTGPKPEAAEPADVSKLNLTPRTFETQFGGIFLFLPYLAQLGFDDLVNQVQLPGSGKVPALQSMLSLLACKLYGNARHRHVMSHVFDEGLALLAGLNTVPKKAFLTEYSCRVAPDTVPKLNALWFERLRAHGIEPGTSFDLDFHTIPFHGEDALVEKHYVSKRSRRQKGMLAFLVRDAANNTFCFADCNLRKSEQNDAVITFCEDWRRRTGHFPEEVIFDSKLTTYKNLHWLNAQGINFMTLRRRSKELLQQIKDAEPSAWRRIHLSGVGRQYRTPLILDQRTTLAGYDRPIRQIVITELGHDEPTFLLTNQMTRGAGSLIDRYAKRMLIENAIADGIDFFHMDALSSAVPMKLNVDLLLTCMASSLYRMLGTDVGRGYEAARARTLFRDLLQCTSTVTVTPSDIVVRFQKRAHNPLLVAAGFRDRVTTPALAWKSTAPLCLRRGW